MRDSHLLELQRRSLHGKWTSYKRGQTCDTFHIEKQGIGADTRRDTWALKKMYAQSNETLYFGLGISNDIRETCGKMWHLSGQFQVIQANWKCE